MWNALANKNHTIQPERAKATRSTTRDMISLRTAPGIQATKEAKASSILLEGHTEASMNTFGVSGARPTTLSGSSNCGCSMRPLACSAASLADSIGPSPGNLEASALGSPVTPMPGAGPAVGKIQSGSKPVQEGALVWAQSSGAKP